MAASYDNPDTIQYHIVKQLWENGLPIFDCGYKNYWDRDEAYPTTLFVLVHYFKTEYILNELLILAKEKLEKEPECVSLRENTKLFWAIDERYGNLINIDHERKSMSNFHLIVDIYFILKGIKTVGREEALKFYKDVLKSCESSRHRRLYSLQNSINASLTSLEKEMQG